MSFIQTALTQIETAFDSRDASTMVIDAAASFDRPQKHITMPSGYIRMALTFCQQHRFFF